MIDIMRAILETNRRSHAELRARRLGTDATTTRIS